MDTTSAFLFIRATVTYDGTEFLGFQVQEPRSVRTVQRALEEALAQVTQTPTRVVASGRTDAGVHARGQVVAFRIAWRHSLADLQRALNAVLPEDVAVLELGLAEPGWHPRFSARRRHYRYTVLNQPVRSPLDRRYAYQVARRLDMAALRAATECLIGEHDFASFGGPTQGDSTVRVIYGAEWRTDGQWLTFDVIGNAFLRGMVRNLVGSLLQVGLGYWPVEHMRLVLQSRDRARCAPPAPACGLCLMAVHYD